MEMQLVHCCVIESYWTHWLFLWKHYQQNKAWLRVVLMSSSIFGFLASACFQRNIRQLHFILPVVFRAAYMAVGQVGGSLRDQSSSFFPQLFVRMHNAKIADKGLCLLLVQWTYVLGVMHSPIVSYRCNPSAVFCTFGNTWWDHELTKNSCFACSYAI